MVEKKSPVAAVRTEVKKTSVGTVTTAAAKSEETVKEAPKTVSKEEKKEPVKKTAVKKTAEKKPAEKKTTVKKASVKKAEETAPAEVKEPVSSVILQYAGREVQADDWTRRVKEIWKAEGKAEADLKDIKLYVKPEENTVYYVINEDMTGSFEM